MDKNFNASAKPLLSPVYISQLLTHKIKMDWTIIPEKYDELLAKYASLKNENRNLSQRVTHLKLKLNSSSDLTAELPPTPFQRLSTWLSSIHRHKKKLKRLLDSVDLWSFDVIRLEELTNRGPLVTLGMILFDKFEVGSLLSTDLATIRNWLTIIEANYHDKHPYHNSTHATDVMHATAYFLSTERLHEIFTPLDKVICLLAAAVHDVDHPGRTNPNLINAEHRLAITYNDLSVLESHHASYAFQLTLSDPKVNIFQNLDKETYKTVRQGVIDMVLATDMSKHFDHLLKFNEVFQKSFFKVNNAFVGVSTSGTINFSKRQISAQRRSIYRTKILFCPENVNLVEFMTPDNRTLVKQMLIKCADVSNSCRPLKQSLEWSKRIAEERFRQSEDETARGLPLVLPDFVRKTACIPNLQTEFIDFYVKRMFISWNSFLDIPELIDNLKYNYDYWNYLERKGVKDAVLRKSYLKRNPHPVPIMPTSD